MFAFQKFKVYLTLLAASPASCYTRNPAGGGKGAILLPGERPANHSQVQALQAPDVSLDLSQVPKWCPSTFHLLCLSSYLKHFQVCKRYYMRLARHPCAVAKPEKADAILVLNSLPNIRLTNNAGRLHFVKLVHQAVGSHQKLFFLAGSPMNSMMWLVELFPQASIFAEEPIIAVTTSNNRPPKHRESFLDEYTFKHQIDWKVKYSIFGPDVPGGIGAVVGNKDDPSRYQCFSCARTSRVIGIPYFTEDATVDVDVNHPQWHGRKSLVFYMGGLHGTAKVLRERLYQLCYAESDWHCPKTIKVGPSDEKEVGTPDQKQQLAMKLQDALFCLSPSGDTPSRKSTFDALKNGCVPVFFSSCPASFYLDGFANYLGEDKISKFGAAKWSVVLNQTAVFEDKDYMRRTLQAIGDDKHEMARLQSNIKKLRPCLPGSLGPDDTGQTKGTALHTTANILMGRGRYANCAAHYRLS